jgi:hypothetical protein
MWSVKIPEFEENIRIWRVVSSEIYLHVVRKEPDVPEDTYHLYLEDDAPKRRSLSDLHGVITQNTLLFIVTAVITWNHS